MFYSTTEDLNMVAFRKTISTSIPKYMMPTEYHREEILKQNEVARLIVRFIINK